MRITMTDQYAYERTRYCDNLDKCEGVYCHAHRLLWRDCETAKVISGRYSELSDCPKCVRESSIKEGQRLQVEWEARQKKEVV